jgi:chromosomal replication initiator protein
MTATHCPHCHRPLVGAEQRDRRPSPHMARRVARIQELVAKHFGVTVEDIRKKRGTRSRVIPSQVAIYLARQLEPQPTQNELGWLFGDRNHTSILSALRAVERMREAEPTFALELLDLERRISW